MDTSSQDAAEVPLLPNLFLLQGSPLGDIVVLGPLTVHCDNLSGRGEMLLKHTPTDGFDEADAGRNNVLAAISDRPA